MSGRVSRRERHTAAASRTAPGSDRKDLHRSMALLTRLGLALALGLLGLLALPKAP